MAKGKTSLTRSTPRAGPFTDFSREQREVSGRALADLGADTDAHGTPGYSQSNTHTHIPPATHPLPSPAKQRLNWLRNKQGSPLQDKVGT